METPLRDFSTITDEVTRALEQAILSGRFQPNQRLVEQEIAEWVGVSRVPVREALIRLKNTGLVKEIKRNRKVVSSISKREIEELYMIKQLIEAFAIIEACLHNDDDIYLKNMESILSEMDIARKKKDVEQYRRLNHRFHEEMVKAVDNHKLREWYMQVATQVRWCQRYTLFSLRMEQSFDEHQEIVRLCKLKDARGLQELVRQHNVQALERLRSKLEGLQMVGK